LIDTTGTRKYFSEIERIFWNSPSILQDSHRVGVFHWAILCIVRDEIWWHGSIFSLPKALYHLYFSHTDSVIQTLTHRLTYTDTNTCLLIHTLTNTHIHTYIQTYTVTRQRHTHTDGHRHKQTQTQTQADTDTHKLWHTNTDRHRHTQTYLHRHTYTNIGRQTHMRSSIPPKQLSLL